MPTATRSQKQARAAYGRVKERDALKKRKEYSSFAREFPTLIHTCGLCQAVAFARAKGTDLKKGEAHRAYADDLAAVLGLIDGEALAKETRDRAAMAYLILSREALSAAVWLKRHVEALFTEDATEEKAEPEGEENAIM